MKKGLLGVRRNLKEEQRREVLIDTAIKVFSVKGYARATMNDLAADSGFSKALIYWYWENKAALFSELIDRCMVPYCELLQATLDSKDPFEGKFFRFLGEFTALFYDQHLLNRLVHFGSLHNNTDKPLENFKAKVNDYYHQVLHHIEAFLQQGKDSGYFKAELETSSLALFLLLSIEGYIYMSMLEERMPIEQVLIENVAKFISSLASTELPNNGKKRQAYQKQY
jgi:TetR/AcrR family fatty acid metabolism transcriptional regulator